MYYHIAEKIRSIKLHNFTLEQTFCSNNFVILRAGIMPLYCDINKFAG